MDLGAYVQIDNLESIMEQNGILVSRLRGLRLMSDEKLVSKNELSEAKHNKISDDLRALVNGKPRWSLTPVVYEISSHTKKRLERYYVMDKSGYDVLDIRWEKLHGKARKMVKYVMRHSGKAVEKYFALFNSFVGRTDVLYIHARLGSSNWSDIKHWDYRNEPWYISSVDDPYDSTYCDIYARIKPAPQST